MFRPDWFDEQDWMDLLDHRKNKKAKNTKRALSAIVEQVKLAVDMGYTVKQIVDLIVNRNWTGFEVGWLKNSTITPAGQHQDQAAKAIFICAECACHREHGGTCDVTERVLQSSCPNFAHLDPKICEMDRCHRTTLSGASKVIPEPLVKAVKEWRLQHTEIRDRFARLQRMDIRAPQQTTGAAA
jgi:hypothetical protein